jgi:4-amino-4-deoxy-L-arabinose transferase-like glycosyltransferase
MVTDLGMFTGCAIMQYGYTLSHRRPVRAGILIGLGVGVGFMTKGFIAPLLFLFISTVLLLLRNWRTPPFYTSLKIAALSALPWLVVWPLLLYLRSPYLFVEWAWSNNIGRWFEFAGGGHYDEVLYYVKILPWFAWPALPLAAWTVWQARKKVWHEFQYQLPLASFLVMLVTLSMVPNIKDIFALPMLLPLTLLATAALSTLRRGAANALDWFGIMTFGLIAILMWWGWAGLLLDNHAKITLWLKEYQPGFTPTVHGPSFWIALLATLLWLVLVWRVGRSMRRAITNWATGVTLIWVLAMSLWLPWLDSGKSYRSVAVSLTRALPVQHGCVASQHVEDTQLAMLQYLGNLPIRREATDACDLLLTQGGLAAEPLEQDAAWKKIWEGWRSSSKEERFRLYQRAASNKSPT